MLTYVVDVLPVNTALPTAHQQETRQSFRASISKLLEVCAFFSLDLFLDLSHILIPFEQMYLPQRF